MTYQEALCYIEKIPSFAKKTKLDNTRRMLSLLGDPQNGFRIAHVAGTNGKGSVCAFLASIERERGERIGMFTSPHLADIRERIQIDGQMVSESCFAETCERVCAISEQMVEEGWQHPAYFEFLFGMAMDIFFRAKVSTVVLEAGLGGRLDATNVVEHPAVTVIASISMDHMEYLGDTLEEIAREKAGTIKEGIPVVYWGQKENVSRIIEAEAEKKHARAIRLADKNYEILKITNKYIDFCAFCGYYENSLYTLPFPAPYQVENAVLALRAAFCMDSDMDKDSIRRGLLHAVWPGRMEEVCSGIYVDGAHNEDGVRAFVDAVRENQEDKEKYLLFSAVKEKDCEQMVRILCEGIGWKGVILTEIGGSRKLAGDSMLSLFLRYMKNTNGRARIEVFPDIGTAFFEARKRRGADGLLYCAGSLYLAGEVKQLLMEEKARV